MTQMTGHVDEFMAVARQYCAAIERSSMQKPEDVLRGLLTTLPRLYAAAWDLPEVEPASDQVAPRSDEIRQSERRIAAELQSLFGDRDIYRLVYDPHEHEEPTVMSTIGGDLAEIYADLREVLEEYDSGRSGDGVDAIWEARFGMTTHWGRHLLDAMKALHWIATDRGLPTSRVE